MKRHFQTGILQRFMEDKEIEELEGQYNKHCRGFGSKRIEPTEEDKKRLEHFKSEYQPGMAFLPWFVENYPELFDGKKRNQVGSRLIRRLQQTALWLIIDEGWSK